MANIYVSYHLTAPLYILYGGLLVEVIICNCSGGSGVFFCVSCVCLLWGHVKMELTE